MFAKRHILSTNFKANDTVEVRVECQITHTQHVVVVPEVGYRQWITGNALIQNALPMLSKYDRELLISGTSKEGWETLYGGDDE